MTTLPSLRPQLLVAAFALSLFVGCLPDTALEPTARILCSTDADCPAGFACNSIGRCVSRDRTDREGPKLVGTPTLLASTVRRGGAQQVTFELDENAEVRVSVRSGGRSRDMAEEAANGRVRSFRYVADDADVEGLATLEAVAVDEVGNESRLALPGFLLDFTPPALAGQPRVTPAAAKAGANVIAELATDDPAATIEVRLVGSAGAAATFEKRGDAYGWTVPESGPEDGAYEVLATLTDAAGNVSADVRLGTVRLDRVAPAPEWRVEPAGPARAGTQATFVVTAAEPLAASPALVLTDGQRTRRLSGVVAGSVATFSYTVLAEDHGRWSVSGEALADEAGNAATLATGAFEVDAIAPGFLTEPTLAEGSSLREGAELAVTVEPDETATVEVRFIDRAGAEWPLVATSESRFARIVTTQEAEGAGSVTITLRDAAGNLTTRTLGPVFVDRTPPARMTGFDRITPASPARAAASATLAFEFVTSEPVASVEALTSPDVGSFDVVIAGTRVLGTRALSGATPPEGEVLLDVRLVDAAGNVTVERMGAWTIDTTAPSAQARDLGPTTAKEGTRVSVRLEPSEPVTARLTLGGTAFTSSDGLSFALDVTGSMPEGDQPVMADLTDLAGNMSRVAMGSVRVDFTPPRVLPGVSIGPARPVKDGDVVTVRVEGSEALSACTAAIGGVAMERDPAVAMPVCAFRHAVGASEGDGAKTISVTLVDAAGNGVASDVGSIVYDFTLPALTASDVVSTPTPAGVDDILRIVATASEPLSAATLVTTLQLPLSTATIEGAVAAWNRLVREGEPEGPIGGRFVLVDLAGNQAEIELGPIAQVDASSPQVVRSSVFVTQLAKVGATVRVFFESSEPLAEPPVVTVGGAACEREPASTNLRHGCTHVVTAAEGEGDKAVQVSMFDGANRITQGVGIVRYDFTAPKVLPADLVAAPNPAGVGALLRIAVSADEALSDATLQLVPAYALPDAVLSGRSAVWSRVLNEGDVQGQIGARLQVTDLAGNRGEFSFDGIMSVDATVPTVKPGTTQVTRLAKVGDVVEASFDSSEPLPIAPEVTIEGAACVRATGSTSTHHVCRYTVPPTATSGLKRIDVVLRDGVNVGRMPLGNVTFDVDPPLITTQDVRALSPIVGSGGTIVVQARASEALSAAALEITAPPGLVFEGPLVTGDTATWTHLVNGADTPGIVDAKISVSDVAGNQSSVVVNGLVRIDNVAPMVLGAATLSTSRCKAGDTVTLLFTASEDLVEDPEALIGPTSMDLASKSGRTYRYTHVVTAAEPEVLHVVHAKLVDPAGNSNDMTIGLLTYDFTPPSIISSTVGLSIDPPPTSLVYDVTAAGIGSKVRLSFTASESLSAAPVLTSTPDAVTFNSTLSAGSSQAFEALVAPGVHVDGVQTVRARMTDLVGNVATAVLVTQALVVDSVPPAVPAVAVADRIVHERRPWGGIDGAPAGGTVTGLAGAVEGGSRVIIVEGNTANGARLASIVTAAPDGAFAPIDTGSVDRPQVGVVSVDAAGNASFGAVKDGVWTVRPTSDTSNPHTLAAISRAGTTLTDVSASVDVAGAGSATDARNLVATAAYRWVARTPGVVPAGGEGAAMAFDSARGRAVLFGGATGQTWEWDGERWADVTPTDGGPTARTEHVMAYDAARDRVLLFGGRSGGVLFDDTWSWDGRRWKREFSLVVPQARASAAMAYDERRARVVLFGGRSAADSSTYLADTWEWDGAGWTRIAAVSAPPARDRATLTFDPTRNVSVLFGGKAYVSSADVTKSDTWEWDGAAWQQVTIAAGGEPSPRFGHAAGYDAACGCVLIHGGISALGALATLYADTWAYRGANWVSLGSTGPTARYGAASTVVDGAWLVFGGNFSALFAGELRDTWLRKPGLPGPGWSDVTPSPLTPPSRYGHSMAYDPRGSGVVHMLYGQNSSGYVTGALTSTDHWNFDGRGWSRVDPNLLDPAPTARGQAAAAIAADGSMVLFGGGVVSGGTTTYPSSTTATWNGTNWGVSLLDNPPVRLAHGMARLGASGPTVMFGGQGSALYGDTWLWSGSGWTQASPVSSPSARSGHVMVSDPVRDRVLVVGGSSSPTAVTFSETWAWDGTSWTRLAAPNTPGRRDAAAASDTLRGRSVLFGGNRVAPPAGWGFSSSSVSTSLAGTWVFNGTNWAAETADLGEPPSREGAALAYDARRDRVVLFGGRQVNRSMGVVLSSSVLSDTWELLPPSSPAALASFDWSAAQVNVATVLQVGVEATVGATGSTTDALNGGAVSHGTTLEYWDAWTGIWRPLGTNTASASAPGALAAATSAASDAARWFLRGATVRVRARPTTPEGNGAAHASVAVDALQLRVKYRR